MESIVLAFLLGAMLAPSFWPAASASDAESTNPASGRLGAYMKAPCIPQTPSSPSPMTTIIYLQITPSE